MNIPSPAAATHEIPTPALTARQRQIAREMSQWFVPHCDGFPTLDEADPTEAVLELALDQLNPGLPAILAAIDAADGRDVADYLDQLEQADGPAFEWLRTLFVGRYLTCRPVWDVLGYNGRRPAPIRAGEADEYLADGLLEPSIARGKIYRPTPSERDETSPEAAHPPTVALVGLGNMGRELARTLIAGEARLTVWNRSAAAASAFAGSAVVAPDPIACVRGADVVITCLSDYAVTSEVLETPAALEALRGKVLVQLASGTPDEARRLARLCQESGIAYLDGKIFTYPSRIGDAGSVIAYSGSDEAVFVRHAETLRLLGGASRFVGSDPGAAAVLDLAWLSTLYGATLGILQGAAFCGALDVPLDALFDLAPSWLAEVRQESELYRRQLTQEHYEGDQATLDVHLAAAQHLLGTAQALPGLTDHFPAYLVETLRSLTASGRGGQELAAAIAAFRR